MRTVCHVTDSMAITSEMSYHDDSVSPFNEALAELVYMHLYSSEPGEEEITYHRNYRFPVRHAEIF
jgi:hypothetical protein